MTISLASSMSQPVVAETTSSAQTLELSVIMPCLNEADTLGTCVRKAMQALRDAGIEGEVIVADNGSTDGSQEIALSLGARLIQVSAKGYGSALMGGIQAAHGKYILMGDADDSYDFSDVRPFLERLRQGDDLVMGNRFAGKIYPGAMPWKNRYIGNPVLTTIGRCFFKCPARDFHCGLRAFNAEACRRMDLRTTGMEFASEMVIKATLQKMRISEVPTSLRKDGRNRAPHLRPWRDGWRHLRFMLLFSPRWLFLVPGVIAILCGLLGYALAMPRVSIFGAILDVHTLLFASLAMIVGYQAICFSFFTKVFAISERLLPPDPRMERFFEILTLERGIIGGALACLCGACLLAIAIFSWYRVDFGPLDYTKTMRWVIPGITLFALGFQTIWASFFVSILAMKRN
jgi:glycosyltransferase involved in cell wall biosynthesis